jgi:hypothetical protein
MRPGESGSTALVVTPCGYHSVVEASPRCQQKAATAFGCGLHEPPFRFALFTTAATDTLGRTVSSSAIIGL